MMFEPAAEPAVEGAVLPSPGSPPGMTASKSSKSSSFHSLSSDDSSVLSDANHFEEIGLDDDAAAAAHVPYDRVTDVKSLPNRFSPSFSSDLRAASLQLRSPRLRPSWDPARTRPHRDAVSVSVPVPVSVPAPGPLPKSRPTPPSLQSHVRSINVRSTSTSALVPESVPIRTLGGRSPGAFPPYRHRSPSPGLFLSPRDPNLLMKPRRSSWQASRGRKSAVQLEQECDEDDGDDIPDGLVLDNVPISPRPPSERSASRTPSEAGSPERVAKERLRSVGNGTPPVALAHGSLRSPTWRSDMAISGLGSSAPSEAPSPLKARAKSWSAALADLSAEAKALTEKLEEHADDVEHGRAQRSSTGSMPTARRPADACEAKPRHKSALAELPPLRRTNIMIDPLPVSKEKEAVLSRTRPSWLPPKDPAEEKRHLREYQRMMMQSAEADRRREAARRSRSECRDTAVDGLMQIWERDVLPRWDEAVRERRTRELWWRGVAPRSRGAVWARAIGNELGLTEVSYEAALRRAREAEARLGSGGAAADDAKHAAWFAAIRRDVEDRTWKDLRIFQTGAPLHQSLVDVLSAYAMYRSDIGYVTGCNTIAALLLLNLPNPSSAFVALANVLNRPLPLSFYASDTGAKASAYNLLLQTLSRKSPSLHGHITQLRDHDPDAYLADVFTALFTGHLALDQVSRLWDVYVFEGDAALVRAGVAFLLQKEMALHGTKSMAEVRAALEGPRDGGEKRQLVVAQHGDEERWMQAVREAGRV